MVPTIVLTIAICFACCRCCISINVSTFRKMNSVRVRDNLVFKSGLTSSALTCIVRCKENVNCKTVSWNAVSKECRMSASNTFHISYVYIVVDPNFVMYSEKMWKVWHINGPGGSYSMTYAEAQGQCALTNGRLATPTELLAERAMGFYFCSCGWLADGTIGFVLQEYTPACWSTFTDGIHTCNRILANAYCVKV